MRYAIATIVPSRQARSTNFGAYLDSVTAIFREVGKVFIMSYLTYTVRRDEADSATIMLVGEMAFHNELLDLEIETRRLQLAGVKRFVFDCEQLEYMNSSGLFLLIRLKRGASSVVVRNPNDMLRGVLALTGAATIITVE